VLFIGITMMSLGIIGSYIFRVYQEVLRRPRYLITQQVNMTEAADRKPAQDFAT
jgi:hypothetical protein